MKDAPPPLSCIPLVVMQKTSQGLNWTENADNADEAEITQAAYFLRFANGMNRIREGLAERGGFVFDRYVKLQSRKRLSANGALIKIGAVLDS